MCAFRTTMTPWEWQLPRLSRIGDGSASAVWGSPASDTPFERAFAIAVHPAAAQTKSSKHMAGEVPAGNMREAALLDAAIDHGVRRLSYGAAVGALAALLLFRTPASRSAAVAACAGFGAGVAFVGAYIWRS